MPFPSFIQSQPQCVQEILQTHELPGDLTPRKDALQDGSLEAVTDGSYKKSIGMATAAWIVTTADSSIECLGSIHLVF